MDIADQHFCPLCKAPAVKLGSHPGYQQPKTFEIYYCESCDSSFAYPLEVDEKIYDLIYANAAIVPGYSRYQRLAREVLEVPNPLDHLAESEDVYWAVRQYFRTTKIPKSERVLEVGCGLGYLTYALAKEGYDITGLDISEAAIENARKMYGQHFLHGDLFQVGAAGRGKYDVIILTEVIEHVPDVTALLIAIDQILAEGGEILITTPNKSIYPASVMWDTEPPPVHLWWLSETSMRVLAHRLGYHLRFIDFTELHRRRRVKHGANPKLSKSPVFDRSGRLIHAENPLRSYARAFVTRFKFLYRPALKIYLWRLSLQKNREEIFTRSLTLCAVFSKTSPSRTDKSRDPAA